MNPASTHENCQHAPKYHIYHRNGERQNDDIFCSNYCDKSVHINATTGMTSIIDKYYIVTMSLTDIATQYPLAWSSGQCDTKNDKNLSCWAVKALHPIRAFLCYINFDSAQSKPMDGIPIGTAENPDPTKTVSLDQPQEGVD